MNIERDYLKLLNDIMTNGVKKEDRTGTGTISVFGRQIRHKMSEGFPLLTTKKMPFKTITTELLWFLRGDSDIRFLWKNNCTIWDGDWEKHYKTTCSKPYTLEEVKQKVKDGNHNFHDSMFDIGPIYGKQWRKWSYEAGEINKGGIDQIQNLINDLKTNPDSRRLMVNAWNVGELHQMTLPPCHYGFQVYTRELTFNERWSLYSETPYDGNVIGLMNTLDYLDDKNIPTRAISLMWNQRSVDTPLGLPFNIASYALLLELLAMEVNMVPDELVGNLGDCHIYLDQLDGVREQLTREPMPLGKLSINTEFWNPDGNVFDQLDIRPTDFQVLGYESHPAIKFPLSN